jgi:hypothetical protein
LTDDDVIVRYENGDVVGLTILHASQRWLAKRRIQKTAILNISDMPECFNRASIIPLMDSRQKHQGVAD